MKVHLHFVKESFSGATTFRVRIGSVGVWDALLGYAVGQKYRVVRVSGEDWRLYDQTGSRRVKGWRLMRAIRRAYYMWELFDQNNNM